MPLTVGQTIGSFSVLPPMQYLDRYGLKEIQWAPQGIITDSYPDDPSAAGRDLFFEPTRR